MARKTITSPAYPAPLQRLIDQLSQLPGVGRRSAERMAFHLLKGAAQAASELSRAIIDVKSSLHCCTICFNLGDATPCTICASPDRDGSSVLVVEQVRDLLNLEQTGLFKGVYHVLTGAIDPLSGVQPSDLTIPALLRRIDDPAANSRQSPVREIILGLNPNMEGDTTALYLAEELGRRPNVKVTRLARGLPAGSQLEFANRAVLADAIQGRQPM